MEIITSGRRTGKTETLLRWMLMGLPKPGEGENSWDRTILVASRQRAAELRDRLRKHLKAPLVWAEGNEADAEAYRKWCVVSANIEVVGDVLGARKLGNAYWPGKYVIDDLDDVLATLFGGVPTVVTRRPDGDR